MKKLLILLSIPFLSFGQNIEGCMDNLAYNYNSNANTDNGSCYYAPGCTDPQYLEYYTQGYVADYNNGDCQTEAVWGCTDSLAFNYDIAANLDNGGCIPVIYGCTDPLADNYDGGANVDDGSCEYPPASYNVYRDGSLLESGISINSYVDSGLGASETQCYVVSKVDMGVEIFITY